MGCWIEIPRSQSDQCTNRGKRKTNRRVKKNAVQLRANIQTFNRRPSWWISVFTGTHHCSVGTMVSHFFIMLRSIFDVRTWRRRKGESFRRIWKRQGPGRTSDACCAIASCGCAIGNQKYIQTPVDMFTNFCDYGAEQTSSCMGGSRRRVGTVCNGSDQPIRPKR